MGMEGRVQLPAGARQPHMPVWVAVQMALPGSVGLGVSASQGQTFPCQGVGRKSRIFPAPGLDKVKSGGSPGLKVGHGCFLVVLCLLSPGIVSVCCT